MPGNPLLKQATEQIEAAVPEQFKEAFTAILVDGLKLMFSPQTHRTMQQHLSKITSPEQVAPVVAEGISSAILTIIDRGKIPPEPEHPFYAASVAVAQVLACHALEYIEQKRGIQITPDLLAQTIKAVHVAMMKLYGITPEIAKRAHAAAQQQQSRPGQPPQQPAKGPQPPTGAA